MTEFVKKDVTFFLMLYKLLYNQIKIAKTQMFKFKQSSIYAYKAPLTPLQVQV